jgi:protein-arginine kinase
VRLGAALGLLPVDMARVQRLMLEIQPAHLSLLRPDAAAGDDAERSARAEYVRAALD